MKEYVLFIVVGFVLLVNGANLLIKGASNIAKKFHIPEIIIGLTIVSIGTSLPELIITISSAVKGNTELIVGNAIGSNICNLLLILGVASAINPLKIDDEAKKLHIPISLAATLIILLLGSEVTGTGDVVINRQRGIILLSLFIIYFSYPIYVSVKDFLHRNDEENSENTKKINIFLSIIYIIIGVLFLKYGGDFVVDNAEEIAKYFNISDRIIGLTIVAIGTALPELITSIVATIKGDSDLAVGNIIGSNIFNLLLILGVGAIITPIAITTEFIGNLILLAGGTLLVWTYNFWGTKNTIGRFQGVILIILYVGYTINLFIA